MTKKTGGKRPRRASDKREQRNTREPERSGQRTAGVIAGQKAAFVAAFRECGTILHAAAAAQVGRSTIYDWLKTDDAFATEFRQATDDFVDTLEREAVRRARDGVIEPVFGNTQETVEVSPGKFRTVTTTAEVGAIVKFSDKLMEVLLRGNRRDKYNTRQHEISGKDGAPLVLEPSKLSEQQLEQVLGLLSAVVGGEQK